MVIFLISLIIIALVIYLGVYLFKRHKAKQIEVYQAKVNEITENSLEKELAEISKLNLSGDSLTEFEKVDKDYREIINRKLPEISELLNDLRELNQHYQFGRINHELKDVDEKLSGTAAQFEKIKEELKNIRKVTEEHQKAVEELSEKYKDLRKTLLAKSFSFGPSSDKLEEQLGELEQQFNDYTKLMESGDYVKSAKPLSDLQDATAEMEEKVEKIPPIFKNLKSVFPDQLKELNSAVDQLLKEKYVFHEDLKKKLADIQKMVDKNFENLKKVDLKNATKLDEKLTTDIDKVYDEIDQEYRARKVVEKNYNYYQDFVEHAERQEHELLIDLDRLSQNYELTHNEFEDAHDLQVQIQAIRKDFDNFMKQRSEGVIYSDELKRQKDNIDKLTKIEKKQKEINDGVSNLWKEEKEAQKAVQGFDLEIHRMRRDVEKLNLPGLSREYTDYFFKVSDEIENLDDALGQIQINMDEITKALINTQSDLDVLGDKTKEIIDCATLSEEFLQYANRYRTRYPEVEEAYKKASQLFNKEYNYVDALDTISNAVEEVEPGAYKRITDDYESREQAQRQYPMN
ncbi:septation ring formation regulator EzrA [Ligilactobacillus aviarius]|uniref:septation ring formation regulator EzrA n=1 Tax=Ligilactobacillus aviarius TaxID=1606 RepID=UPI0007D8E6D3|nr:septation ring formation regulator EzrA [Ligilactobacillus aviarius]OAQ03978.1 septation ring formation regulator EzrA [Ligilactobacillus aviarius]OAQ04507.1 septation ring formation regulator EzrA [Ligilactobacillus aviarius]OAQ08463.1 septation ring formation regulator EzrA [Ligilactobacillus aviarius]OAS76912.1 septation ring formation regulator EzrA [Ligilactobacillus aviarius]OAS81546.1 septation ring formation regulator EzrA [Ligilactobacillus aviarius]